MIQSDDDDGAVRHILDAALGDSSPKHVAAAVSGGSDSMALLSYLRIWARAREIKVSAMTVDHGLRDSSGVEAAGVAKFCAAEGIPHVTLNWRGWDGTGNLQARARDARYRLMAEYARANGIDMIALGHTEDDLAETLLMRLARKSGLDGLAGMQAQFHRHGVEWVRPVLGCKRRDLRAHLQRRGIGWVQDPSNEDLRFERVQARNILANLADLDIDAAGLAKVSQNLSMARNALEYYTVQEARTHGQADAGDLILPQHDDLPGEILRRLTAAALQWIGRGTYAPRGRAVEELLAGLHQTGTHCLAGCHVSLSKEMIRFTREFNAIKGLRSSTRSIWDERWLLEGPHVDDLEVGALGEAGLRQCPDWRECGLPRISLIAAPAIWRGDTLVAAPLAGFENGWRAELRQPFVQFLEGRARNHDGAPD